MSEFDKTYHAQLENILARGETRTDRTGTGTKGLFGLQGHYDLRLGFPLLTTKKIFTRGVFAELLWIMSGSTNINPLLEQNVHIWDEWADEDGELGPVYGKQWRSFGPEGIDQLVNVVEAIKRDPFSRRHMVTAWDPASIPDSKLPPCHVMFQFYVTPDAGGRPTWLSCQLYQRSGDMFLGVPFNIASYSLLTHMVAQQTGLKAKAFVHTLGDAHIYLNHIEQVRAQLNRTSRPAPTLILNEAPHILAYTMDDIVIEGYKPHPPISAPVAV